MHIWQVHNFLRFDPQELGRRLQSWGAPKAKAKAQPAQVTTARHVRWNQGKNKGQKRGKWQDLVKKGINPKTGKPFEGPMNPSRWRWEEGEGGGGKWEAANGGGFGRMGGRGGWVGWMLVRWMLVLVGWMLVLVGWMLVLVGWMLVRWMLVGWMLVGWMLVEWMSKAWALQDPPGMLPLAVMLQLVVMNPNQPEVDIAHKAWRPIFKRKRAASYGQQLYQEAGSILEDLQEHFDDDPEQDEGDALPPAAPGAVPKSMSMPPPTTFPPEPPTHDT